MDPALAGSIYLTPSGNRPLGAILAQTLLHDDNLVVFQDGRFNAVVPSCENRIRNHVMEHGDLIHDISPKVALALLGYVFLISYPLYPQGYEFSL